MPHDSTEFVRKLLGDKEFMALLRRDVELLCRGANANIDADDLLQDVAARAIAKGDTFRGESPGALRNWLRTIARNLVVDRARRNAGKEQARVEEELVGQHREPSAEIEAANADEIGRLLQNLSPFEVALLKARYQQGLSFETIARIIGRAPEYVRQYHHRLLKRLRESRKSK